MLLLNSFYFFKRESADTTKVYVVLNMDWMPDGKSIVFTGARFDRSRKTPPKFTIFRVDPDTKVISKVLDDAADVSVSADGKKIAFVDKKEPLRWTSDIYMYNLVTGEKTQVVSDTFRKSNPSWSPDGNKIVFNLMRNSQNGHRDAQMDIRIIDLGTGNISQISENDGLKSFNPMWAPHGDYIVYYQEKGDNRDKIYLTDSEGSFHRNLTADTSTHNFYPSWYNDKIIFTRASNMKMIDINGKSIVSVPKINSFRTVYNKMADKFTFLERNNNEIKVFDLKSGKTSVAFNKENFESMLKN